MTFTIAPTLTTERLRLRPHRSEDFETYAQMWSDPDVVKHISGKPSTLQESWFRLMRGMGMWAMLGYGYWVVEDKTDNRFLGEVGLADFKREMSPSISGIPEAGWVVTPEAQGRGFATEAMQAVLQWADKTLNSTKTVCILDPDYDASRNVALKLGYSDVTLTQFNDRPTLLMERFRSA